jgi:hypothetical protein
MPDENSGMMAGAQPAGTPAGAQPSSAQPEQGQATGSTPATMPVANQGGVAKAQAILAGITQLLQSLVLPGLPVGSDAARDVREALNKLAKHVPTGPASQGAMTAGQQNLLLQQRQNQPQIAAMRASQTGGGAAPPGAPQPAM